MYQDPFLQSPFNLNPPEEYFGQSQYFASLNPPSGTGTTPDLEQAPYLLNENYPFGLDEEFSNRLQDPVARNDIGTELEPQPLATPPGLPHPRDSIASKFLCEVCQRPFQRRCDLK